LEEAEDAAVHGVERQAWLGGAFRHKKAPNFSWVEAACFS
jgi:hypothetical protein